MKDHTITFFEACETLNRSRKSVSRYVRRGLLHPTTIKSKNGTREYRFSLQDLEEFKGRDQTGQEETTQDEPRREVEKVEDLQPDSRETTQDQTRQDSALVPFLMEQIKVKDEHIKVQGAQITELIERDKEKNFLLKGYQDRVMELEKGD